MPRYIVERTFPTGLHIPLDAEGAQACIEVVDRNAVEGVTWVHSYVNDEKTRTFCVYDAPTPEAIRPNPDGVYAGKNTLMRPFNRG